MMINAELLELRYQITRMILANNTNVNSRIEYYKVKGGNYVDYYTILSKGEEFSLSALMGLKSTEIPNNVRREVEYLKQRNDPIDPNQVRIEILVADRDFVLRQGAALAKRQRTCC